MQTIKQLQYQTAGGITVRRSSYKLDYLCAIDQLIDQLDSQRGVLLASSFEYPGRYTRWDLGFVNPPLAVSSQGRQMQIVALNNRGEILLPEIYHALQGNTDIASLEQSPTTVRLAVRDDLVVQREELRSRQPSVFSVLRSLVALFRSGADSYLGLYGAFGYDLGFQFEDVIRHQYRARQDRDLLLYLPDQVVVADHRTEEAISFNYEFVCRSWKGASRTETTGGFRRTGDSDPFRPGVPGDGSCDHQRGEYAECVSRALDEFRQGNLFEVVPGQVFSEPCVSSPAQIFRRLKSGNPAPYGALINLGQQEYLVAASPEMFVRVDGRQMETCPISGTIKRGGDAIADAEQIRKLLNSRKDESELSMCTDVDRNDKSRVCVPGSVRVIGRRQIEMYSRLIHTVDHVVGELAPEYDALDGFLAHTWAVTVTGAPKHAAMQFVEANEKSARHWYGGAMGQIGFDGNLNTGLTLRTIRIHDSVAEIRAGATLLIDSDPEAEEAETRLKASALLDAIRGTTVHSAAPDALVARLAAVKRGAAGLRVLMVDHQDSFVHNLAAYFRQFGVDLVTLRPAAARKYLQAEPLDLVILSPGPARPADFAMGETLSLCMARQLPTFGVCLGLQGIVEHFGGQLGLLDYPMHGKPSRVLAGEGMLFRGLGSAFVAGRYHSLQATSVPACLKVTARDESGVVMAVEHRSLPVFAVQFHPESIMTLEDSLGLRLIANVVEYVSSATRLQQTG